MSGTTITETTPVAPQINEKITADTQTPNQTSQSKPLTIVFCLPGDNFSSTFLRCWSSLFSYCIKNNINAVLSSHRSNNVYYVRNMCLGGDFRLGVEQKPFNGKLEYDYIMWIDSDQVFGPRQFEALLSHFVNPQTQTPQTPQSTTPKSIDVVSGLYMMENNREYAVVRKLDGEYLMKNGSFEFLTPEEMTKWVKENLIGTPEEKEDGSGNKYLDLSGCTIPLMEVEYSGLGWTLMRKGVFEQLEYPWFNQLPIEIHDTQPTTDTQTKPKVIVRDYCGEDTALFIKLREKGIKCYVDVTATVGHEKKVIL